MRLFARFIAVTLMLCMALPAMAAQEGQTGLNEVSKDIKAFTGKVNAQVKQVDASIVKDRKALLGHVKKLKAESAAMRKKAKQLENRLRQLREKEDTLERQLEGNRATMRKIESCAKDNAGLFLAARRAEPAFVGNEEWVAKLKSINTPGRFPEMDDISFLMDSLLEATRLNGVVTIGKETVFTRDGSTATASVARLGALQALYATPDETGFLSLVGQGELPESAAYVPDEREASLIRSVISGSGIFPVDFSHGALLANPPEKRTLFSTLKEGGFFLWPILMIGFVGLLIVIERCFTLGRIKVNGKRKKQCKGCKQGPADRVLKRMRCQHNPDPEIMEKRLEEALLDELPPLERFLQTLKVMAAISPLLGLLGTVSGIIQTFRVITAHGNGDPKLLSAGISEALLTTELGLLVAIPLLLSHHFLSRRVNTIVLDMEMAGTSLIVQGGEKREGAC